MYFQIYILCWMIGCDLFTNTADLKERPGTALKNINIMMCYSNSGHVNGSGGVKSPTPPDQLDLHAYWPSVMLT